MAIKSSLWPHSNAPVGDTALNCPLFCLGGSRALGSGIAKELGVPLSPIEERTFEDGEHKTRPLVSVRGEDVFVVQSLHAGPSESANDKLCRLLFFIGTLKDAGANRVTAVVPYLCYARKDRRTKPNDPVTVRYIASLFEAVGTDALLTLDVHNPAAFENAFRCSTIALTAAPLFIDYVLKLPEALCVVSPDPGGVKRAEILRESLEEVSGRIVTKGFVDKHRSAGIVSGEMFVGDADGRTVLIIDDLLSSGHTLLRAARAVRASGANRVIAMVTHGLFMPDAERLLSDPALDRLVITDAVPPFRITSIPPTGKLDILACGPLLAEAIKRMLLGLAMDDLLVF